MTFPFLIVGVIFLLTNWFPGEHTVGWILTGFGTLGILLQILIVFAGFVAISRKSRF